MTENKKIIGIEELVIGDALTKAINQHLYNENLNFDDLIGDIVIVKFDDGLMNVDVSYNKKTDEYEMHSRIMNEGEEILKTSNQRLHYITHHGKMFPEQ